MKNLYAKKIGEIGLSLVKEVVVAGVLSLASSKLRELSNTNYRETNDNLKQGINLTKNKVLGADPDDWDL